MKTGQEVSCKAVLHVLQFLEQKKVETGPLLATMPYPREHVCDPSKRVSWESFCDFMVRVERAVGGPEALAECGAASTSAASYKGMFRLIGYVATPALLYKAASRFAVPMLFHGVVDELTELPNGQLHITQTIPESYRDCPQMFLTSIGGLRSAPTILGLAPARVEYTITPRQCIYLVTPPLSFSIWTRFRRAFTAIFFAQAALEHMAAQEREMTQSYAKTIEAELKLKLSNQMSWVSKMTALGEMSAGVAHEINNPLAIVTMSASLLAQGLEDGNVDRTFVLKQVERVRGAADRIAKIVSGLRAFTRDAGNDPCKPVSLNTLVQDTLQFCQQRFATEKVQIQFAPLSSDLFANGRATQISQALLNLMNNAFDAAVKCPERWIRVELAENAEQVEISVIDSGAGIPEAQRGKLFQPFFTTKPIGSGTGLGLSVARGTIESQGGTIEFDPSSAQTRFVIRLPRAPAASQAA